MFSLMLIINCILRNVVRSSEERKSRKSSEISPNTLISKYLINSLFINTIIF